MATLARNVHVDGTWYGPAHGNADRVPADVAERITNPRAWGEGEGAVPPAAVEEQQTGAAPSRPDRSDPKAAWVDHAVTQGMNREDAEAMTKAALVSLYSDKD